MRAQNDCVADRVVYLLVNYRGEERDEGLGQRLALDLWVGLWSGFQKRGHRHVNSRNQRATKRQWVVVPAWYGNCGGRKGVDRLLTHSKKESSANNLLRSRQASDRYWVNFLGDPHSTPWGWDRVWDGEGGGAVEKYSELNGDPLRIIISISWSQFKTQLWVLEKEHFKPSFLVFKLGEEILASQDCDKD